MSTINDPHKIGSNITVPYTYLSNENKRFIYNSVNSVIIPKLQDILRSNTLGMDHPFLQMVFMKKNELKNIYNFENIDDFIDRYLNLTFLKFNIQKQISELLSLNSENNTPIIDNLIKKCSELEIDYFAYSSLIKEYAEKIGNYLIKIDNSFIDFINYIPSGSFFFQLLKKYQQYNAGTIDKKEFLYNFFNNEPVFLDEYLRTNKLDNYVLNLNSNTSIMTQFQNGVFQKKYESFLKLIQIDNIIDKYIEFKKPFLHDLLGSYLIKFGNLQDLSIDHLEEIIEHVFNSYKKGDKNNSIIKEKSLGIININDAILYDTGNKGKNLSVLSNHGIDIAPGFFINHDLIQKISEDKIGSDTKREICDYIKSHIGEHIVIRSNFLGEDGDTKSYAGLFNSYIDINTDDVFEYIKKVIDSGNNVLNTDYTNQDLLPGVLIQEFIKGDFSGVAFVQDNNIVIEVTKGLNDKLVDGKIQPTLYEKDEQTGMLHVKGLNFLKSTQLENLIDQVNKISEIFNKNVDIEFTIKDNQVIIFQVRPITKKLQLNNKQHIQSVELGNDINVIHDGLFEGDLFFVNNVEDIKLINKPCIIVTDSLYTDLAFKSKYIKGIISKNGGHLSHLSLLCRELGIPLWTNCNTSKIKNYNTVIYDGDNISFS